MWENHQGRGEIRATGVSHELLSRSRYYLILNSSAALTLASLFLVDALNLAITDPQSGAEYFDLVRNDAGSTIHGSSSGQPVESPTSGWI